MRDAFSDCHPAVNFSYFASVLLFSMFVVHPVFLGISLCASVTYAVCLKGAKAFSSYKYMLPMLIFIIAVNSLFNHEGATILTYFPSGNPLTLESVIYGAAAACMMISVIQWFYCCTEVITSDKFVYIFGRVIPTLSLLLSMTLRFIPRFQAQYKIVRDAQKSMGRDISKGNIWKKMKHGAGILSVMITWSMENSIETADSMKARGYGLPGRTAFSIYHFEKRDIYTLSVIMITSLYVLAGCFTGGVSFRYFPLTAGKINGIYTVSIYVAYFLLCFTPVFMHIREDRKWKYLRQRI